MAVLKRYDGSQWVTPVLRRYNGTTWECVDLNRYDGAGWVDVQTACAPMINDPLDVSGCLQWLDMTQMPVVANDTLITEWTNMSDSGQDGPSHWSSSVKPKYKTAANGINGKPTLWFDGIDDQLTYFADILAGVTAATVFVVGQLNDDPPTVGLSAHYGFWRFGTHADADRVPSSDSIIYDGFCSTTRKTTGSTGGVMDSPFLYNVVSGPSDWRNYLNGTLLHQTSTNTFAARTECEIGITLTPEIVALYGHLGEFILYDSVLSESNRQAVEAYLIDKWGV